MANITVTEIRELKEYYEGDLYPHVRSEQVTDQSYIDDSFGIPEVKPPHIPMRTGIGYHVVNAPAEQIVTSNPQAFFYTDKKTDIEATKRISREVNDVWISNLSKQIPNLFKEVVKNDLSRGESYIQLCHNELWVTGKKQRYGMPVLFTAPEPMVVYGSPEEDDCGWIPNIGVPNRVVVIYPVQPSMLLKRYPSWTNPKGRKLSVKENGTPDMVNWWAYYDKNVRYIEADGQPLLEGEIQPNLYGFTPFVRKYSGFGKRSPQGNLEDLIFSDIRMSRGLIQEYTSIGSDISSSIHIFAHKPITLILPDGTEVNEDELKKNIDFGSYRINILYMPPEGKIIFGDEKGQMLPSLEVFQHYKDVEAKILQRHPFLMAGFPGGSSGRQQDMTRTMGMARYDTVIENTEDQVATAIEMGLQIYKKVPTLLDGSGIKKEDIGIDYRCEVKLRAPDPIEDDRLATLGSRLYAQGEIDLETNLVHYQKKTQSQAEDIITNILVDRVTFQSPDVAELMGLKLAEKAGLANDLQMLRQRRQQIEQGANGQTPTTMGAATMAAMPTQGASAIQRAVGQTTTALGREMIDEALKNRGARTPPSNYTRQA